MENEESSVNLLTGVLIKKSKTLTIEEMAGNEYAESKSSVYISKLINKLYTVNIQ